MLNKEAELQSVIDDMMTNSLASLYKHPCVKWAKITSDSNKIYTELISEYILNNNIIERYSLLEKSSRKGGYIIDTHDDPITVKANIKGYFSEENLAKALVLKYRGSMYAGLGRIVDFQIPLKSPGLTNKSINAGLGKIDLVSIDNGVLYVIELKVSSSRETLLRAILEIITYYNIINRDDLRDDMSNKYSEMATNVVPCVFVPKNSVAGKEFEDLPNRPFLKRLIMELHRSCGLKVIVFDESTII